MTNSHSTELPSQSPRQSSLGLHSALFVSLLFILGLAALVFWPAESAAPPRRPALSAPIVFDEFVDANATSASGDAK